MRFAVALVALAVTMTACGCAVPTTPPTPVKELHDSDPVSGTGYWLYVPSTYRSDRPAPLIITCHGTPPYDVANMHIREFKHYGEINGCIVVAPELIGTDGILGDGPISGMLSDERRIMSIISTLSYRYNIDRANVMITGFSGGGFPTYFVGLRHPDVFSVVVARSCNFSEGNLDGWWNPEALRTAVKIYYGENDPGAIKAQSRRGIDYLRSRGFVVEEEMIPGIGHERRPQVAMDYFRRHWRTPVPSKSDTRR